MKPPSELSQFEKSVSVQQEAIARLDMQQYRGSLESHLRLYRSGSPIRE
jgi:hypothetical protein